MKTVFDLTAEIEIILVMDSQNLIKEELAINFFEIFEPPNFFDHCIHYYYYHEALAKMTK